MSQDIQRMIESLIQQGEMLLVQLAKIKEPGLTVERELLKDALSEGAGFIARDVLELPGGGRHARKYTRAFFNQQQKRQLAEAERAVEAQFTSWFQNIRGFLSTVSIQKPRLKPTGNSFELVRQLNKVRTYKRLETKIRNTIRILNTFSNQPLIFNKDIPQFLEKVQFEKKKKAAKEIVLLPKRPFTGLRELKNILKNAEGYVKIIDPYVGEETLDLLIDIPEKLSIRFLTSHTGGKDKERRFRRLCQKFKIERPGFEIRKCDPKLIHDRFILARRKGWSVGTSLKDIGKKLSMIKEMSSQVKAEMETIFEKIWSNSHELLT